MKLSDQALQRLLTAAATAPPAPAAPPLGLETRVLTHWRAAKPDDDSASVFAVFRRAVLGASLVLVLSAVWSLSRPAASPAGDEAALLDYDIQMSLTP
jgi:hypothetical protein